jgi:predicted DNA-binding ribbon-helix-helix protein
MCLDPAIWGALEEICQPENLTRHQLCGKIYKFSYATGWTAAIRVFIVNYFRAAATEDGRANICHGALCKKEARVGHASCSGNTHGRSVAIFETRCARRPQDKKFELTHHQTTIVTTVSITTGDCMAGLGPIAALRQPAGRGNAG